MCDGTNLGKAAAATVIADCLRAGEPLHRGPGARPRWGCSGEVDLWPPRRDPPQGRDSGVPDRAARGATPRATCRTGRDSLVSEGTAAFVVAIAAVVLAGITGIYAWSTHQILKETRRQIELALGKDARSLQEKHRRLLILGRRLCLLVTDVAAHQDSPGGLRRIPLWTQEEIGRFESLCTELSEVPMTLRPTPPGDLPTYATPYSLPGRVTSFMTRSTTTKSCVRSSGPSSSAQPET
jgi:hypothetical protein